MDHNPRTHSTLGLLPTGCFLVLHLFIALFLYLCIESDRLWTRLTQSVTIAIPSLHSLQSPLSINSCTVSTLGLLFKGLFRVIHLFIAFYHRALHIVLILHIIWF